jgi:hypothetical protein
LHKRIIAGLLLAVAGFVLIVGTVVFWFLGVIPGLQLWLGAVVGIVCLVVGLGLVATDLLEAFLRRGSTALVDGLQAG